MTVSAPSDGRTVEEDEAVAVGDTLERLGKEPLAVPALRKLGSRAGQVGSGRDQLEIREPRAGREVERLGAVEQVVARSPVRALSEPRCGVCLGVEVDEQRALAGLGETGGEVHGRRRLADAALLVRERVDGHRRANATQANGRFLAIPGLRGKPSGVVLSLGMTTRPSRSSG